MIELKVGTAQDAGRLDETVMSYYSIDQSLLMENAALAARDVIACRWGIESKAILVVCGVGNNGGDGFALARLLHSRGAAVTVLVAGDVEKISGAANSNFQSARQLSLECFFLDTAPKPKILSKIDFSCFDIIVDALFGTGLSRNVLGRMENLIHTINDSKIPVLSLDIPSGVDSDSGQVLGCAVKAEATVSFGLLKRGNLLYPGHQLGGTLYFSEISFPPEVYEDDVLCLSLNLPKELPERLPSGHKGSFGKVLIIGGCPEYRGAPALAAQGALRGGAGYAKLAVPGEIAADVFSQIPEAVLLPMEGAAYLGTEHLGVLSEYSTHSDITVLGSGLSCSQESLSLTQEFVLASKGLLLIDGDSLTAVAGRDELTKNRESPTILTPHSGEMARLIGCSVREVEKSRVEVAMEAAERYGCVVVLKGAHSIIADQEGQAWINLSGNSSLGTAGSGDVLSGLIAALALGNLDTREAVCLAVYLHGLAGDLAAEKMGEHGVLARDILDMIPQAMTIFPQRRAENLYSGKIFRV